MRVDRNIAIGHAAAAAAYIIFGINVVVCRDIAIEGHIEPIVLFSMRALVAGALFWLLALLGTKRRRDEETSGREKVPSKDLLKLAGAAILGLFLPQLTFLHAIVYTTPVDLSVMSTTTPIFTMFVAAIFLREPITWKKVLGVAMSFALYLGTCRNLISRYSVVTGMKWMFLVAFLVSLPFSLPKLATTHFAAVSTQVWWEIGFMIFFSTFIAYYLIPVGQKRIRPTLVSMYGYLQPIIAIAVAIWTGMDHLTVTKVVAAIFVFSGVWVVNNSRAAGTNVELKTKN